MALQAHCFTRELLEDAIRIDEPDHRFSVRDGEQVRIQFRPVNSNATFEVTEEFMSIR